MTFALKKKKKIELRPFLGWVGLVRGGWQVRLAPCDCCSGLRRGSGRGRRSVPDSLLLSHRTWAPPLPPTHHEPPAAPPQPLIRQVTGRPTPTLHPATSQTSSKTSTPTSSLLELPVSYLWRYPGTAPRVGTIFNFQQELPAANFQPPTQFKLTNIPNLTFQLQTWNMKRENICLQKI